MIQTQLVKFLPYQIILILFRMGEGFVLDDRNIKINLIGKIQPTQVQNYILLIERHNLYLGLSYM